MDNRAEELITHRERLNEKTSCNKDDAIVRSATITLFFEIAVNTKVRPQAPYKMLGVKS